MTTTRKIIGKKKISKLPKRNRKTFPYQPRKWKSRKKNKVQRLNLTYRALCYNWYPDTAPPFSFGAFQYLYFVHNPTEAIAWLYRFKDKTTKERLELYLKLAQKIAKTKTPKRCKGIYLNLKGSFLRRCRRQIHTLKADLSGRKYGKIPYWSLFIRTILKVTGASEYFQAMIDYGKWWQH